MTEQPLLSRSAGAILLLTLNRPEAYNALTVLMLEALDRSLDAAGKDPAVKAIVLTGSGTAFCAGQDLREHFSRRPSYLAELRGRYNPLILRIRRLPKPVIAAVNGTAAGAGMSLALACDFRLCVPEARFHTSFVRIGLVPDSGNLYWLASQIGAGRALELELTGRPVTAEEALAWGLVNRVAPAGRLIEETEAFVKPLAEGPSKAIALTKQLLNKALFAKDLPGLLEEEALLQEVAGRTEDHAEGLAAFVEKRRPRFVGR